MTFVPTNFYCWVVHFCVLHLKWNIKTELTFANHEHHMWLSILADNRQQNKKCMQQVSLLWFNKKIKIKKITIPLKPPESKSLMLRLHTKIHAGTEWSPTAQCVIKDFFISGQKWGSSSSPPVSVSHCSGAAGCSFPYGFPLPPPSPPPNCPLLLLLLLLLIITVSSRSP